MVSCRGSVPTCSRGEGRVQEFHQDEGGASGVVSSGNVLAEGRRHGEPELAGGNGGVQWHVHTSKAWRPFYRQCRRVEAAQGCVRVAWGRAIWPGRLDGAATAMGGMSSRERGGARVEFARRQEGLVLGQTWGG